MSTKMTPKDEYSKPIPAGNICDDPQIELTDNEHAPSDGGTYDSPDGDVEDISEQRERYNQIIGAKENRRVSISRTVVIVVFGLAAVGVGLATWFYTTGKEQEEFENAFNGLAEEVIQVSQINANNNFESLKALADLVTTYAVGSNSTWPFVTHPNWPAVASTALERLDARFVAFVPFVEPQLRETWEAWTVQEQGWIQEAINFEGDDFIAMPIVEHLFRFDPSLPDNPFVYDSSDPSDSGYPFYLPLWQSTLVTNPPFMNFNSWNDAPFAQSTKAILESEEPVMSQPFGDWQYDPSAVLALPEALICQPLFDGFGQDAEIVGILDANIPLKPFDGILSEEGSDGILVVLSNPCAEPNDFTWEIFGQDTVYRGQGDQHDPSYNKYKVYSQATALRTTDDCPYTISLYPSKYFEEQFKTNDPAIFTVATVSIFFITALFFFVYDFLVARRQVKVVSTAQRSGAILDSMFPARIRDRLIADHAAAANISKRNTSVQKYKTEEAPIIFATKPIADYYPVGTVLVADISNFSAWSSVREPAQVFTLLETLYANFDAIAKKRKVYKVETLGDRYVACCNVPDPREDHVLVMARFARDCRTRMRKVVQQLEISLGPGTGNLCMRFAIHTGPVIAGVLRGERSRFQLFGDTIDFCFKLEAEAEPDEIILSKATANFIKERNLSQWLTPGVTPVRIKGVGDIQTYWLDYNNTGKAGPVVGGVDDEVVSFNVLPESDSETQNGPTGKNGPQQQTDRLVAWNVDVLTRLLKSIIAMRDDSAITDHHGAMVPQQKAAVDGPLTILDEVCEIIPLRKDASKYKRDPLSIQLEPAVEEQLRAYVSTISYLYRPNHFHNFEHACHVTQAVTKLLSRVVTPECIDTSTMTYRQKAEAEELHQYTYGITSDPLIQFACALSALIHDVDHPGVPNTQLVKEQSDTAVLYKNKSVAEQNSVELAWDLLMEPNYRALRECIYSSQQELDRFRQLVVNSVMATDIVDKELGAQRKKRWSKAFEESKEESSSGGEMSDQHQDIDKVHRKATIVIEHLVQAADVSHMMQHWNVYIKWNENFFRECYRAYSDGRADKDPSIGWYEGELGFFDFYIIPLAKKLQSCGVFGVSSDEYLQYAQTNRREWEIKGRGVVATYLEYFEDK